MSSSRGLQVVWAIALHFLATPAIAQEDSQPRGVNPKDNITKLDLIYTHDDFDDDVQIDSLAFKYDRALGPDWGFNIEVPLVNFDAPGLSEFGIGDANFRARYVETRGRISYLGGGELVLPTASADVLGAGKWQLNPIVGAVLGLSQTAFIYVGYKHLLSFAGDGDRPDINASQPRLLGAITSAQGWWVLGDLKYTYSWEDETDVLEIEGEAGRMLSSNMALSLRAGTATGDTSKNWKLSLNWRYIF